ncbi:MAG: hypothetical protein JWR19_4596 [Pedosphaera sp.]|nr:hypothetical protein [Pedosphaera sp.]
MMSRVGKIARLPKAVRFKLNLRLENGESQRALVVWLNKLPAVQKVLAGEFEGRPINEQNLTAWKQGGFAESRAQEELVAHACEMGKEGVEFLREREERNGKHKESFAQNLGLCLAMRIAGMITEWDRDPSSERLKRNLRVLRKLTRAVVALQLAEVRAGQWHLRELKSGAQQNEQARGRVLAAEFRAWVGAAAVANRHGATRVGQSLSGKVGT